MDESFHSAAKLGFNTLHADHPEMLPSADRLILLNSMTLAELRNLARTKDINIIGKSSKDDVVKVLMDALGDS